MTVPVNPVKYCVHPSGAERHVLERLLYFIALNYCSRLWGSLQDIWLTLILHDLGVFPALVQQKVRSLHSLLISTITKNGVNYYPYPLKKNHSLITMLTGEISAQCRRSCSVRGRCKCRCNAICRPGWSRCNRSRVRLSNVKCVKVHPELANVGTTLANLRVQH